MNPLRSPKIYPRTDNAFKSKSSLNFDAMRAKIYEDRRDDRNNSQIWIANALIGISCGFAAFAVNSLEEELAIFRFDKTQELIESEHNPMAKSLSFYILSAVFLCLCAGSMTIFFGPGASGSGIAELMGILNGVNIPDVIGFKTLITKIVATALAVAGGLAIGKEGPLAHIGANIGVMVSHLPS